MSTSTEQKQKKPGQECNRCKAAGFPNQSIWFQNIGTDSATGKIKWKLVDENGNEHVHKGQQQQQQKPAASSAGGAGIGASDAAINNLAGAIRELAAEIRNSFGRQS
jgi:hypothetical protein